MEKIPKQEYTAEFKERVVKHVKEGKSIGPSAKELAQSLAGSPEYGSILISELQPKARC